MATNRASAAGEDTFPKLLLRNARRWPKRPAIREKDLGIWQTWTWAEVLDEVRSFALGLKVLGLGPSAKVAIVGSNRPRLYWTMTAVQSLGAVPVPVYQDSVAEEMRFVLEHAEVSFAVVEDQEQVDKMIEIRERAGIIDQIVYDDPRGLKNYNISGMHSFEDVQKLGRETLKENTKAEADWLAGIEKGSGENIAIILYTSGTTGTPKGVVLSQKNVVESARNANAFDKLSEKEDAIAYLPMAWVGDHIFSFGQCYEAGFCISCPESAETVDTDRREIGPTFFFAPPRIFETLLTDIMVRMEDAARPKRAMFRYFLAHARKVGERVLKRERIGPVNRLLYFLGELLVYGPVKNRLGFSRLRVGYTAGEAIGPEIFSFYRSLGVNLKQLYGQTEASVYVTMQPDGEIYPDTVGKPAIDVEIRIADSGEVMYRSPGVFMEYYKNPEATREAKTEDGWVHSGDAGVFDDRGHLRIIDRARDVGRLKNGVMFPPKYIENRLKFYPNIKEVVAFGHGREFVAVFINIDLTALSSWAERNNLSFASYQELASHPRVYEIIEGHVDELNRELATEGELAGCQIRRFLILHKELDADDGEITRTNKVRRTFIAERYTPLIEALYDTSKKTQHVRTEVRYEDGRLGSIEADVEIRDMKIHPATQSVQEAAE